MKLRFCYLIPGAEKHAQTNVFADGEHSVGYIHSMVEMNPDTIFFYTVESTDIFI